MDPLILKKFNAGRAQTNDLKYDEKADIWSIGALCYQMLIGNSPFDAYNMQELVEKIEEGTYKVPTNLSKEVVSFLNGMLQYDPNKRLTAENLSNHAFLTKNVSDFTHINTNMISRKVYGGQLNINIKNNQSIWAIFNEENQKTFDNIPGNFYTSDAPLSESVYIESQDNTPGITSRPFDVEQNNLDRQFNKTESVPIISINKQSQTSSSSPPFGNEGLNMPQVPLKNTSDGRFQTSQTPTQQNQYNNQNNQVNPQMMDNQIQQQPDFFTVKNGLYLNNPNSPPVQPTQTSQQTTQMQQVQRAQQMQQQNYQMKNPFPNNNIVVNSGQNKPPTVQHNPSPQIINKEMATNQNTNVRYQMNNNRNLYNPNQMQNMNQINQMKNMNQINQMQNMNQINQMQNMNQINQIQNMNPINQTQNMNPINQIQNMNQINQMQNKQNLYQRNPQGQLLQPNAQTQYQQQTAHIRRAVQNPLANQIPQRGINNINNINNQPINPQINQPRYAIRPGQVNNMPKPINPSPNQVAPQRQIYQVRPGQPLNPVINPQNQQRNRVVTPQKNIMHNNYPNSNLQNGKKIVRPQFNPEPRVLNRAPSNPNVINNNYNIAQPAYQQNIHQIQTPNAPKNMINNRMAAQPGQNGAIKKVLFVRPNTNQTGGNFNVVPRKNF
jgi:hypothetical protein